MNSSGWRFECTGDTIPTKWAELSIIPGYETDHFILIQSNGIVGSSGQDITMDTVVKEAEGTMDQVLEILQNKIKFLEHNNYKLI